MSIYGAAVVCVMKTDRLFLETEEIKVAEKAGGGGGCGLSVVLLVFMAIALAQANNDNVFAACGRDLYNVVILDIVILFMVAIVLVCCVGCFIGAGGGKEPAAIGAAVVLLVVCFIMSVLNFHFSEVARSNPYCVGNLTETGLFKTTAPALLVVGYINGSLYLIAVVVGCIGGLAAVLGFKIFA